MSFVSWLHSYEPSATLVEVGFLSVRWYGLLMALGMMAGYVLTRNLWRRRGLPLSDLDNLMVGAIIFGLLGARLVDVFVFEWWYFKDNLTDIFQFWRGGLSWHGGLLGGLIYLWLKNFKQKGILWTWLDCLAPGLALGQAIGRWGNYFNQELFGQPTTLPWGIPIARENRPLEFINTPYFHPVFLYESIGLLLVAGWLWYYSRKKLNPGQLFALYLIATGVIRFALEFLRLDEQNLFLGVRVGLWLAGASIICGVLLGCNFFNFYRQAVGK